jgi:hypothetical protein
MNGLVSLATSTGLSYITTHHVLAGGFTVLVVMASFYIFYHSLQVPVKVEEQKGEVTSNNFTDRVSRLQ